MKANEVRISLDGKGLWMDNVFVERLWRRLKYEEVFLKAYETVREARQSIDYFRYFNAERRHSALGRRTPDTVLFDHRTLRQTA